MDDNLNKCENQVSDVLGYRDILKFLPHRFPFVMVDRVEVVDGDNHGIGIKNVTLNEPWLPGHFPDNPVMPGVFMVEMLGQASAVLVTHHLHVSGITKDSDAYGVTLLKVDNFRFRLPVVPGDQLRVECKKINYKKNIWRFRGIFRVDNAVVAEGEVVATSRPINYSDIVKKTL